MPWDWVDIAALLLKDCHVIPAVIGREAGHTLDRSTGQHRDKQPHTLTLTPMDNLESLINLTCTLLDGGMKPEYQERSHPYMWRKCKLHTERPQLGIKHGTLLLRGDGADHHTTVQPTSEL